MRSFYVTYLPNGTKAHLTRQAPHQDMPELERTRRTLCGRVGYSRGADDPVKRRDIDLRSVSSVCTACANTAHNTWRRERQPEGAS